MTWRLWQLLNRTADNHHMLLVRNDAVSASPESTRSAWESDAVPLAVLFIFSATMCSVFVNQTAVLITLMVPVALILASGTVSGAFMAGRITSAIVLERQRRRLDLLAVTPIGRFGIYWLMAYLVFHKSLGRITAHRFNQVVCITTGIVGLWSVFVTLWIDSAMSDYFRFGVVLTFLSLCLYIDTRQSTVLGAIFGLLFAGKSSPWIVSGSFALLQLPIYVFFVLVVLTMDTVPGIVAISLLVVLREVGIRYLWGQVVHHYHVTKPEMTDLLQGV